MAFLMILLGFLSGLMMMHGLLIPVGKYYSSGMLWGREIKGKGNTCYWLMALGGLVLLILLFVLMGAVDDGFDYIFHSMIALPVGIGFSFFTWYLEQKKCFASDHIISAVKDVPFMPELERLAETADRIEMGADGILFYDSTNFCTGGIRFADYRIGNTPANQMFFAAYALAQKFNGTFKYGASDTAGPNGTTTRTYIYRRK